MTEITAPPQPEPTPAQGMSDRTKLQLLLLIGIIGLFVYLLAPILTPFAVAALLGYLGDPLVDQLERRGFSRTNSVVLVFVAMSLVIILVLLLLIPVLEAQISQLIRDLPRYIEWFRSRLEPFLANNLGIETEGLLDLSQITGMLREHWQAAGGFAASALASVSKSGLAVVAWLVNLALIPVLTFYFLRDWDGLVARISEVIPRTLADTATRLAYQSDQVLGGFLRGQLLVMASLATIYTVGLWLVGIDYALLIGMGAGLVSFIPYLGTISGLVAAVVAALVQYHDVLHLVLVLIVFGIGQVAEGFVLTPKLVGDRIGLHPVVVIFAIMAGGQLFGFVGVLIGLPVAAIVMVILRHLHEQYLGSELYGLQAASAGTVSVAAEPAESASGESTGSTSANDKSPPDS